MMAARQVRRGQRRTLELNATALMTSTVLTGVLGVVFWVVAARISPPVAVGRASATLSAITFLAGLAQLNMTSLLVRFVPGAAAAAGGFIARAYGLALTCALILTGMFLTLGFGGRILGYAWYVPLAFLATTALCSIFFVQDGALAALGAAVWVPVENLIFGACRVLLLVLLARLSEQWGALLALTAPIVAAVMVVNWYVFRRLVPRKAAQSPPTAELRWRDIKGFAAADYLSTAVGSCVTLLPPVMVSAVLGSEANAFFYVPWFTCVTFGTLMWNIQVAFVAESGTNPPTLPRLVERTAWLTALVSAAACLITVVAAPLLLAALGSRYAAEGSTTLRLVALSFPFSAFIIFHTALCVIRKKLAVLVAVQSVKALVFLTVSAVLLRRLGVDGLAVTYLACEGLAALALLSRTAHLYRRLTSPAGVRDLAPADLRAGLDPVHGGPR